MFGFFSPTTDGSSAEPVLARNWRTSMLWTILAFSVRCSRSGHLLHVGRLHHILLVVAVVVLVISSSPAAGSLGRVAGDDAADAPVAVVTRASSTGVSVAAGCGAIRQRGSRRFSHAPWNGRSAGPFRWEEA
jgi:hypothetical protein